MGHPTAKNALSSSKLLALGLLKSVVALAYVVVKHTRRASKKLVHKVSLKGSSKCLIGRRGREEEFDFGFGGGGLWQRSIMMGDRCEPLDFSGVIYYDCDGKRVNDPPMKSPRATPFAGFGDQQVVAVEGHGSR